MVEFNMVESRGKDLKGLSTQLAELKEQLFQSRIEIQVKGNRQNFRIIHKLRKDIARTMTIIQEKRIAAALEELKGSSHIPKRFRPKMTRALRRKLTPRQEALKVSKVAKRESIYRERKYAVLA